MKAVFTNTVWSGVSAARWPHVDEMGAPPHDRYSPYPFWLSVATKAAKVGGHEAQMVNPYAQYLDEKAYYRLLKKSSPDVFVIESSTRTYPLDEKIIERVKKEVGSEVAVVGTMPSARPGILGENKNIDYVFCGEYELGVAELLDELGKRNPKLEKIKGLGYRKGKKEIYNGQRPLCELDSLPFPNWEDDNLWLYHDGFIRNYPGLQLHASRGCLFRCPYCQWNQLMYREKYRMFSNKYVIDMIEYGLENLPACKELYFDDDNFTQRPKKHMIELCRMMIKAGWDLPFSTMGHAQTVSRQELEWMKKAGLTTCKWGLETHEQEILNNIGKGLQISQFEKTLKAASELGVVNHVTVMFGLPGQSYQSCLDTIDYVVSLYKRRWIDTVQFAIATPFLGTRFYDDAVKNGWVKDLDLRNFDGKTKSVLEYPELSAAQMEEALKKGVGALYRQRALRFLKENIFNPQELLVAAAKQVERRRRKKNCD